MKICLNESCFKIVGLGHCNFSANFDNANDPCENTARLKNNSTHFFKENSKEKNTKMFVSSRAFDWFRPFFPRQLQKILIKVIRQF